MNRKRNIIRSAILALTLLMSLMMAGCMQKTEENTESQYIYCLNIDETKVVPKEYQPVASGTEELLKEYIEALQTAPKETELKNAITEDVPLLDYEYTEGLLRLDFGEEYLSMEKFYEILRRAAIVRTLMQVDKVEGVIFTVNGVPVTDSKLQPIGVMTADMFVDNNGSEINSYEKAELHLYFANEVGDGLKTSTETVMYSSNISLDKLVVEHIIEGPDSENCYPVAGKNIKILGVTTKDGTCYLNFSQEFLTKEYSVSDEVVIYSFVNSLTELPNINKVQFMIDSETSITFGDHIYLSEPFERNLEIMAEKM